MGATVCDLVYYEVAPGRTHHLFWKKSRHNTHVAFEGKGGCDLVVLRGHTHHVLWKADASAPVSTKYLYIRQQNDTPASKDDCRKTSDTDTQNRCRRLQSLSLKADTLDPAMRCAFPPSTAGLGRMPKCFPRNTDGYLRATQSPDVHKPSQTTKHSKQKEVDNQEINNDACEGCKFHSTMLPNNNMCHEGCENKANMKLFTRKSAPLSNDFRPNNAVPEVGLRFRQS